MQVKQETDKSAAVATVVAAVDMARVREPVTSAVEQTQRTTTTAVHIQPAQDQVRVRPPRLSLVCRNAMTSQCSNHFEDSTEATVAQTFRTL